MRNCTKGVMVALAALLLTGSGSFAQDAANMQKQIDQIKSVIPKFAIPMREVGDRFQNMYFAAKGGNWALAAYMSKYMNGAMGPASLTKPNEYPAWKGFYEKTFAPVDAAIKAKDLKAFEAAYTAVIPNCNACHQGMGYGFIKVVKLSAPADNGIDYKVKSNPGDVPP
jgi:cytochrome c556